ncbi:MAG: ABC transporter permease [Defluviitaleaceae bacterium]|nr:ABC transporter permease [Defluviitaleaceae bacterium]
MLAHEIKLLLTAYKKILFGVSFLALFCAIVIALAAALPGRMLFAPFTIGVVDNDNSQEITLLLEMLRNHESLGEIISFERMPPEDAAARLDADEIPAYIIIPEGFTQGIIIGENPPITLVGNESRVLQLAVTRLLVSAGVAFLTTSQAGIYSTLNYAHEQGMAWDEIIAFLMLPVNIEYMRALLAYNEFFVRTELSATDDIPPEEYYLNSVLLFLMYIFLITLVGAIFTSPAIMRRWRMCGVPLIKIMLTKWIALWVLISIFLTPLMPFYGAVLLAVAVLLSGLALMSAQLFASEQAAGLFLFTFAVVTLFVSGGALPLAFLPEIFGRLSVFIPNYWFIRISSADWITYAIFCGYGVLFFAAAYVGMRARNRS